MKEFTDMTKAELLKAIEERGLDGKLAELGADPKKITNDKLIELLNGGTTPTKAVEVAEEEPMPKGRKMTQADVEEFYNTAIPVIIVDHDKSYTIKDDSENRVIEVNWGNPVIGKTREKVALHGLRQYITNGAIKAMKDMTIPRVSINENTGAVTQLPPRPRFTITDVTGFTQNELDALKEKQRLEFN